jgi:L-serine dehydratase
VVAAYPDIFNDVFGPVMQPGSSSHTAGPCRLGRLAHDLLGEPASSIHVELDRDGSFAGTFGVMAEDRAMVAGALGMQLDDERLFHSFEVAAETGADVDFEFTRLEESDHPNAMRFVLTGRSGRRVTLTGESTGGGMVETVEVDGLPLRVRGDAYVALAFDPGQAMDAAAVRTWSQGLPGLLETGGSRGAAGVALHVAHLQSEPAQDALHASVAAWPGVRVALLRPVLPVLASTDRRPQLFDSMTRWREIAADRELPLWEVAVEYERDTSGWPRERVLGFMRELAAVMHRQTRAAYEPGVEPPTSPFKPDFTSGWARHEASPHRLSGDLTAQTLRWAYGAGAGIPGVPTVPGPMGSGGGYVYAALSAVRDAHGMSEDDLLRGLFVAGGVGAIAFSRTEPTGEVLGCGGEGGVCGAMAAAGIAEMAGGAPQQVEDAASHALQAFVGMPCDPIPGGSCQPCRSRLLTVACMAHVFADIALAGHSAVLPLHEAFDMLDAVGRSLPPELLCTARGGACATPTARAVGEQYRRWVEQTPPGERPPGNLI